MCNIENFRNMKKREKMGINKIRNEGKDIKTDALEIQRIIIDYYEHWIGLVR